MGLKITASTATITRFVRKAGNCSRATLTLSALLLVASFVSGRVLAQGTQQEVTYSSSYANGQNLGYLEYLPTAYASGNDDYPLLISLHGLGWRGRGTSIELGRVKQGNHVAKLIEAGRDFSFIVVSPQQPEDVSGRYTYSDSTLDMNGEPASLVWDTDLIDDVIERVKATRRVDTNRIYLTGTSMGGGGVWQYLKDYGSKIAAAVPIAGRTTLDTLNTNYSAAIACSDNVKNTPIWAFHGSSDNIIEPEYTFEGVQAINSCSPAPEEPARFTIYLGVTHFAWDRTYTYTGNTNDYRLSNTYAGSTPYLPNAADNDVFAWMLSHSNGTAAANQGPEVSVDGDALVTLLRPTDNITLEATATDSDGTIASYQWEQVSGPTTASLSGSTSATLSVDNLKLDETFAAQSRPEGYVFRVTVTDNSGASATDEVRVKLNDPDFQQIVPWSYKPSLNWNTSIYKPYRYKDLPFRLLFPTDFDSTANDGKKYPLILHIHGRGENGDTNDKPLVHAGRPHRDAVQNGKFNGYVLVPQYNTTPLFSFALDQTVEIIQLLIANNKVDPNRVYVHGLSNGGEGVWSIITRHPKVFAAASPMSWAQNSLAEPSDIAQYIHIPIWLSQGGKDNRPTPLQGNYMVRTIRAAGGNIRYKYLANTGHGTWNSMYADKDFFPWLLRQNKTDIHVYYLATSFCPGESFSVRMGITAGFDGYEWRKDGQAYPPGLNKNEIVTSAPGDYQVRFRRGSDWTEWSDAVTLDNNRQEQSAKPSVSAKLQSVNLPALDGSTSVTLFAPAGKTTYAWTKDGVIIDGATDSTLTVSAAGAYAVAVEEEEPQETDPPGEYAPPPAPCQSPFSEAIVVTTTNQGGAPQAPNNFSVSAVDPSTVQLQWNDQANNERGFEVYRSEQSGGPYELVAILPANTSSDPVRYEDADLTSNTTYYYQVRAVNNFGGSAYTAEQSAATGVSDFTVSINFSNAATQSYTAPWNNTARASSQNPRIDNLKDSEGGNSGVSLRFFENSSKRWNGTSSDGMSTGLYPNFVRSEYYYATTGTPVVMILEGLSSSLKYNITFYGSANTTANWVTSYQIQQNTVLLDAAQNTDNTVQIAGIAPDANGEIKITVDRGPGSTRAVINAMIVEGYVDDGNPPAAASNPTAVALSGDKVQLDWKDESTNETGFEVYRSTQSGGPYNLLSLLPSNTESYTDSSGIVGRTTYYYQIKAVNTNGGTFLAQEASVQTPNNDPSLDEIESFVLSYGVSRTVTIVASDTDGDPVSVSLSGLPSFASFTNGQNGTGTLLLTPTVADVGNYEVTAVATDAFGGRDEQVFNIIIVNDVYDELIYVNFENGSPAGAPWNNTNGGPAVNTVYSNLIEAVSGTASNVSITVQSGWTGSETLNSSLADIYPKNVVRSYWYTQSQATLLFSGLDAANAYNVAILGNSEANSYTSSYSAGGTTQTANTRFNNETVQLNGLQPNSNGEITLQVASSAVRGLINGIVLQGYPSNSQVLAPTDLTAQSMANSGVKLMWQDNSVNEGNFEIFRGSSSTGPFTPIATVGTNITTYSDANVVAGETYFYQVRATRAGSNSDFSPVVSAIAYSYSILVNLSGTTSPMAPTPWNNTAVSPESELVIQNLVDSNNDPTNVALRIENWETGSDNDLGLTTGNNSGIYPDAVLKSFYFLEPFDPAVEFVVQNLPAGMQYSFTFFGSGDPSIDLFTDLRTEYTIGQKTVILDAFGNTSKTVQIDDIIPTNGEVSISVRSYEGATVEESSDFGIFNALVINAYPFSDGEAPTAPVNLAGTSLSATELRLQWDASSDNVGVVAYKVYNNGSLTTSTANTNIVVAIPPSGEYSYTVTAVDAQGNESRPAGPVVPSQNIPLAPTGLTATTQSDTEILLAWQDASDNEQGFEVFRSLNASSDFVRITTTLVNTTSFLDENLETNTQYFYQVRAVGTDGNSGFTPVVSSRTFVSNNDPVLNTIANQAVVAGQLLSFDVGATDIDGDPLSYSVENLPSFGILTANNNGTATLSFQPSGNDVGTYSIIVTVSDGKGGEDSQVVEITVVSPNGAPTANAGADQTVTDADDNGSEEITLDGSASADGDGEIASYVWTDNGTQIATGVNPTVTLSVGVRTITLTVTDNDGAIDTDEVVITVNSPANESPTADAGVDQALVDADDNGSEEVTLDGSASADGDGSIVSYVWSENGSDLATGVSPNVALAVGTHAIVLTVTDNDGATDSDELVVTISSPANVSPTANAGADQTVLDTDDSGSESVTLDGSVSSDGDGSIASYAWTENGNEVATGVNPTIALAVGSHTIILTVTDDDGATDSDNVTITINAPANQSPVANAGVNQTVTDADNSGSENVALDGSASSDGDGSIASYAWRENGAQIATGVNPTVSLSVGTHTVTLTVTDDDGATGTDEVTVIVNPSTPVADQLVLEAECASVVGSLWQLRSDGTASGGQYAVVPNLRSMDSAPSGASARLVFNVPVGQAASYHLFARVKATSTSSNSFWVRINGGTWIRWWEDIRLGSQFYWNEVVESPFALQSGSNTIEVAYREGDTQLDKLVLNRDGVLPVGLGGPEGCSGAPKATIVASATEGTAPLTVSFDGSSSRDPNGSISSYAWNFGVAGATASGAQASYTFTTPGAYIVSLTVTDNDGQSDIATTTVRVRSDEPVADQIIIEAECASVVGSLWQLRSDGTASGGQYAVVPNLRSMDSAPSGASARLVFNVPVGQAASYHLFARVKATSTSSNSFWVRINGGTWIRWWEDIRLGSQFYWNEVVESPFALQSGSNTIEVAYREGDTQLDKLVLNRDGVLPVGLGGPEGCSGVPTNQKPLASAGADQTVTDVDNSGSESVTLDGSASTDSDGSIVSYVWSENGSQIATGVSPTISLSVGTHTITLTVTDNQGATGNDDVLVVVNAPAPSIPVANAGPDQATIDTDNNGNEEITLDGSASTDANGTITSYVWTINGTQIATGANPAVTLPTGGTTIVLTVTDNDGNTDTDEVVITIEEAGSVDGYALYVNFSNDGFSPQKFVSPWNYTGRATSQNPRMSDLKDADGASTGINLKLFASTASGDRWNGSSSDGVSGSLYPAEVMNSYYFIDFWSPVTMTLEGLDPALTYDFTFYSGVTAGNRTIEYQIGGQTATLNATNNTSETVSITRVAPSANGTIDVSVSRGASFRGVLNAMIVEGYVDNSVVAVSGSPINARTAGAEGLSVELLPNPTSYNNVQLVVGNYDPGTTFRIDLVNTAGITVHSQEYSARGAFDERVKLDLNNAINGVYFVRVFQGSSIVQKRLILE